MALLIVIHVSAIRPGSSNIVQRRPLLSIPSIYCFRKPIDQEPDDVIEKDDANDNEDNKSSDDKYDDDD